MSSTVELIQTKSAAADIITPPQQLGDLSIFSIQVVFTGSNVVGTLKLEASIDNVDYFTVADSTQAVVASTGVFWDVTKSAYKYVRLNWDYTSGTGNITAKFFLKSNVVSFG